MSGHSKWSTIKHKKGAADAKRGKLFSRLIKEITIAAKQGGGSPASNARLRTAVARAQAENMPKDNIEKAIKRGTGELEGVSYEEITYEGYGPAGVAVYLEVLTDNKNRSAAEIRHLFSKHNGNLGENGCVSWLFESKGLILVERENADEERLLELGLEAGAEDVKAEPDSPFEVITDPASFDDVMNALKEAGIDAASSELTKLPKTTVKVEGGDARNVLKMVSALEENDDVQNVYANFDIDEETIAEVMG